MGLRFRKTIKLGDNLKVNFGKTGVSLTATNNKGLSVNINNKGKLKTTVSAKGTGVSYQKEFDLKKLKKDGEDEW